MSFDEVTELGSDIAVYVFENVEPARDRALVKVPTYLEMADFLNNWAKQTIDTKAAGA